MLFHSPLASSSCPFTVKWKQSAVKKLMSIVPSWSQDRKLLVNKGGYFKKRKLCVFVCDVQEVLVPLRSLSTAEEQQQSLF